MLIVREIKEIFISVRVIEPNVVQLCVIPYKVSSGLKDNCFSNFCSQ